MPLGWHPWTVDWYESFRRSPQACSLSTELDWHALRDALVVHSRFMWTGSTEAAAEVRMRLAAFGTTPAERQRLRMEVEVLEPYPVGESGRGGSNASIDPERRRRLAKG